MHCKYRTQKIAISFGILIWRNVIDIQLTLQLLKLTWCHVPRRVLCSMMNLRSSSSEAWRSRRTPFTSRNPRIDSTWRSFSCWRPSRSSSQSTRRCRAFHISRPWQVKLIYAVFNSWSSQNTFVSDIAIFVLKRDVKLQLTNSLSKYFTDTPPPPPVDIIWAMVVSWIRGEIIRTVLCCVVCDNCEQWYAHTYISSSCSWVLV